MMVILTKIVNDVILKALNILARRLILDAWLSPGRVSADWYITLLKIQTKIWIQTKTIKDGIILFNYFQLKFKSLVDH